LAVFVVVAAPSLWLAHRSFERVHREDALSRLSREHAELAEALDDRLEAAEASATRVAKLLDRDLSQLRLDGGEGPDQLFNELLEARDDGTWRSRRELFDGTLEAGTFVSARSTLGPVDRAVLLSAKGLLDAYGVGSSGGWDNLWVLPAGGGIALLWPSHPEFVFDALPDLDYSHTEWVQLTLPERNADGGPRWTDPIFDQTSATWMISVVAPFHRDGRWAGALGHDLPLTSLAAGLTSRLLSDGTSSHLLGQDGSLLLSDRYGVQIDGGGRVTAQDVGDPLLLQALAAVAPPPGQLSARVSDGQRTLFVERSSRSGWCLVHEVSHDAVLAGVHAVFELLWSAFLALAVLLTLLPVLLVARLVRRSVSSLVEASARVSSGDLSHRFPVDGPEEFATIAEALDSMVARLSENQQRTRAVLDTVADGVITVDGQALIESANRSAACMFERPAERMRGQPLSSLGPAFASVEELLLGGEDSSTWSLDALPDARRSDGGAFPVDVRASLTVAAEGRLVTLTVRDLSRRREAERERLALEAELRQAQKMEAVGQLAGGVAHDFNNLLTGIMGYAEELQREAESGSQTWRDAGQILRASERAVGLTRQLLVFSRQQELSPEEIDLNALVSGLAPMLQRLLNEEHELTLSLHPCLGSVCVDAARMEQVVMNLVVNAADALPGGGTIRLTTAEVELSGEQHLPALLDAGRYVTFSVADDGVGMDDEVQASIFDPFFTTKELGRGTGLGLATVFGVVKESEGEVLVRSAPDQGAEFTIYLPRRGDPLPEAGGATRRRPRGGTETILVAEDDAAVRRLVKRLLEDQGYQLLLAADGAEALGLATAHDGPIDLLLSDIVMPGLSGPALADALQGSRPGTPVLFISGWSADALAQRGADPDEVDIVAKPFGLAELSRRVRASMDQRIPVG